MALVKKTLDQILLEAKMITAEQLAQALEEQKKDNKN